MNRDVVTGINHVAVRKGKGKGCLLEEFCISSLDIQMIFTSSETWIKSACTLMYLAPVPLSHLQGAQLGKGVGKKKSPKLLVVDLC